MDRWTISGALRRGVGSAALAACLLCGCGGEGHHVSGKVTFDGKPVPAGKIYFTPDGSKNNAGPTGYANIEDGQYDTSAAGGKAVTGGPTVVRIEGIDPAAPGQQNPADTSGEQVAKALFPSYQTTADLPDETTTKDFDVPAEAATRRDAPEVPQIVP